MERVLGLSRSLLRLVERVVEVAVVLREVEEARFREGPEALVARMRERGLLTRPRSPAARRRLSSVIHRLDVLLHGEQNCYRRALVLVALDRDAANEPFVLGLDVPGGGATGHAWVDGRDAASTKFDVEFRL